MRRHTLILNACAFVSVLVLGSAIASAQCPAGSTCFGEIDSNSQAPAISFSGDIAGARWLTHLGDFQLTFSNDNTATQTLGTGDTTFLGNTYRPKVAFTSTGDVLASGNVNASGNLSANSLVSNSQTSPIQFVGDVDGAKWLAHLGDSELTFSSDNSDTTTLGTGDTPLNGRTYRPKVSLNPNGTLSVSGGIQFADGSVQTAAQSVGPQGPPGPQGPAGPAVHTVAVCSAGIPTCPDGFVVQPLLSPCTVTSDTGSCSVSGAGRCAVCKP